MFINTIDIFQTDERPSKELYIYECGYEKCKPREPYQYEQINYYLIHYILEGEGLFFINDNVYHLKKGDLFLIPPYTDNNYYPIISNPWIYRWVGFNGSKSKELLTNIGFSDTIFIQNYVKDNFINTCFRNIFKNCNKNDLVTALGNLYIFFGKLSKDVKNNNRATINPSENYVNSVIDYININYSKDISIIDIADKINLNRSYLFKIFKQHMNMSPQQYLINFRLNKACELLRKSSYPINEISFLVGFKSSTYFSKIFSKYKKQSPINYRKNFIKS